MRRALLLAGMVALGVVVAAPGASGHALLESSAPGDGELLEAAPEEILLSFSEPLDLGLSSVSVVDSQGAEVDAGELERLGSEREVRLALPQDLSDGVYSVSWRVLSRVDGHTTAGAFTFGVGVAASEVTPSGDATQVEYPSPTPLSVGGRWGFYWGLVLLLGAAMGGLFLFPARVRWAAWLLAIGWAVGALGLVAMVVAEASAADIGLGSLLGSDRGTILLVRAAALVAAGLVGAAALARPGRVAWGALGATTLAAMLVHAYAGHAGAGRNPVLAVGVQWIHIVAVGVWVGGLAWLLVGLVGADSEVRAPAAARFSSIATWAIVFVALTGFLRAWSEVGSLGDLFDTSFGLAAVGKSALFGGMLALGAYNRFRLIPRGRLPTLRRTMSGELAMAVGVFGLTGLMAGLVPPSQLQEEEEVAAAPERVVVEGSDFATTVRMRLTATPGAPGPNAFQARISDYDTGEPVEATAVSLRFSMPDRGDVGTTELELDEVEPGLWRGEGTNLSVAGTWRVGVLIQQPDDAVRLELELETSGAEPEIEVIEGGPGQPDIYVIPLGEGRTVQAYVDPGAAGSNEVHYTFFTPEGGELPMEDIAIRAALEGGEPIELEPRRLTEGHFVASAELETGAWSFTAEATTEDGTVLTATFEEEIE
ncbi:MAG TPA: copper resistance protein CopC [Actinomycetota bacterium]